MKKTLFAMAALATMLPAMGGETNWRLGYAYAGAYNEDYENYERYKFYAFYLDSSDITSTLQNSTLAEFKTTYGNGGFAGEYDWQYKQFWFDVDGYVTTPTNSSDNIWGVVVYENGSDALFSAFAPNHLEDAYIAFDYYDRDNTYVNTYVAFKADSPATPEPATATLSLLALAGLCARRRRK